MYDIIIIGGGPAGLTAAVYARRAGKSVLVLEKAALGGQITWSPKVENFPSGEGGRAKPRPDEVVPNAEQ
jgi:thioredoxin reductase (NADPH)